MDSLGINVIFTYSAIAGDQAPFGGRRKGYDAYPHDFTSGGTDLQAIGEKLKQRIYYPSPERIDLADDGGYRWRYIDTVHYSWHNNTLDSNDISPFAEFDNDTNFVKQKYFSRMNNSAGDSLEVGKAGRLILGYNDQRQGHQMLYSHTFYPFFPNKIANAFSARLEFNLDTLAIDSSNTTLSADNVPLLRVQVLYKRGAVPDIHHLTPDSLGSNILPFVPFKTTPYGSEAGWFKVVDTTITATIWHTLRSSWRIRDTLQSNLVSHDWNFKQLNLPIKNLPHYMIIDTALDGVDGLPEYGGGSVDWAPRFKNLIADPDSLVAFDNGHYTNSGDASTPYFEIRIFSTYRDTIRIRSLTWQDTLADKFLYRARFTGGGKDTTHSLNPDGTYGGMDDSVHFWCKRFADLVATSGCTVRELMFNDVNPYLPSNAMSSLGYFDYMLAKVGLHTEMRPQEGGQKTLVMRRERMSYDAQPPSIVQNQYSHTGSQRYWSNGWQQGHNLNDVFPGDYIPSGSLASGSAWNTSSLDTMQGLVIARPGLTDIFEGYRAYSEVETLAPLTDAFRGTARAALQHRKNKKTAWQSSPPLWGQVDSYAIRDSAYHWLFPKDTLWGRTSDRL